jgi:hypothetical protein
LRKDLRKQWKVSCRAVRTCPIFFITCCFDLLPFFLLQLEAAMYSVNSAQVQVDLWIKNKDIYSDNVYWRNSVNGNITFDKPGLHHYLPPNFHIPKPPEDLPSDIPIDTSSSEDSGQEGWLQRYEEKRRQKRGDDLLRDLALNGTGASGDGNESEGSSSSSERQLLEEDNASFGQNSQESSLQDVQARWLRGRSELSPVVLSEPPYLLDAPQPSMEVKEKSSVENSDEKASRSITLSISDNIHRSSFSENIWNIEPGASVCSSLKSSVSAMVPSITEGETRKIDELIGSKSNFKDYSISRKYEGDTNIIVQSDDTYVYNDTLSPTSERIRNAPCGIEENDISGRCIEENGVMNNENSPTLMQWEWSESAQQWFQVSSSLRNSYETLTNETCKVLSVPNAMNSANNNLVQVEGALVNTFDKIVSYNEPKYQPYSFRDLMAKYNHQFDENEEVFVGEAKSSASIELQEAVDAARAYIAQRSSFTRPGSTKAKKGKESDSFKAGGGVLAAAHQKIDLFSKPSNLGTSTALCKVVTFCFWHILTFCSHLFQI